MVPAKSVDAPRVRWHRSAKSFLMAAKVATPQREYFIRKPGAEKDVIKKHGLWNISLDPSTWLEHWPKSALLVGLWWCFLYFVIRLAFFNSMRKQNRTLCGISVRQPLFSAHMHTTKSVSRCDITNAFSPSTGREPTSMIPEAPIARVRVMHYTSFAGHTMFRGKSLL